MALPWAVDSPAYNPMNPPAPQPSGGIPWLPWALGGMALGFLLPKPKRPKVPTAAQLDAATLPAMREMAKRRLAYLTGAQGAKGGISSADLWERNNLNLMLSQRIAQQMAANRIQAAQAYNDAIQADWRARLAPWINPILGFMGGYNFWNMTHRGY